MGTSNGLGDTMFPDGEQSINTLSINQLVATIKTSVDNAVSPLTTSVKDNTEKIQFLIDENKTLQSTIESQAKRWDDQQRKNNIIIHGLAENTSSPIESIVLNFLESSLTTSLQKHEINMVKRIGLSSGGDKLRPILLAFVSFNTKLSILGKSALLKGTNYSITNDYSNETRAIRQDLMPLLQRLKQKKFKVKLRDRDLWIENKKLSKQEAIDMLNDNTRIRKRSRDSTGMSQNGKEPAEPPSKKPTTPLAETSATATPSRLDKYMYQPPLHTSGAAGVTTPNRMQS